MCKIIKAGWLHYFLLQTFKALKCTIRSALHNLPTFLRALHLYSVRQYRVSCFSYFDVGFFCCFFFFFFFLFCFVLFCFVLFLFFFLGFFNLLLFYFDLFQHIWIFLSAQRRFSIIVSTLITLVSMIRDQLFESLLYFFKSSP